MSSRMALCAVRRNHLKRSAVLAMALGLAPFGLAAQEPAPAPKPPAQEPAKPPAQEPEKGFPPVSESVEVTGNNAQNLVAAIPIEQRRHR